MERANWISRCRALFWMLWKKKKINYFGTSPRPENFWCGHEQPYDFFSVFAISRHLLTTQENQSWSIRRGRISCNWGKKLLIISKAKIFRAALKKSLLVSWCLLHYSGDHRDLYISSSLFYLRFVIMWSQHSSIAWTVTSTAAFYHCWRYTEHSDLWIRCVVYIWYQHSLSLWDIRIYFIFDLINVNGV